MKSYCYSVVGKSFDLRKMFNAHGIIARTASSEEALGKAVNKYFELYPDSCIILTNVFEIEL